MRSLHQYLVAVAVLLVLLLCAAAALIVYEVDRFGRGQSERQLLATTRALSLVVDGELKRYEAVLKALATSGAVQRRDWADFDRAARQILRGDDAWIVVADRTGRQLVNTRMRRGAQLPQGDLPAEAWSELDRGASRICNLARGLVERKIVCIDVPVMNGGKADLVLSVVMRPEQLGEVVGRNQLQPGTYTTLLDRRGIVLWRNTNAERFVGGPATADIRRALARAGEGVQESRSLEGVPTVAAYSRSKLSGWTFLVAVPRSEMRAATRRALAVAAAGAAALLFVGGTVGLLAARRVTGAVRRLVATSVDIQYDRPARFESTGLSEIDAAGRALSDALEARRLSEERYRRIFEQTSDLILTADLQQVITDCNPSAAAAVGLSRENALGRKIAEFVSAEDFGRTTEMLRQKLTAGGTTRYDVRVRSVTGENLLWEINSGLTYDGDGVAIGLHVVGRDVTERKRAEERQRLLLHELNHRVKNTLAVVQSIAHQTLRSGTALETREAFASRLAALSAAHDVLTRESWTSASMTEIVAGAIAPFCDADRCRLEGPDVRLNPRTAVSVALAIHELATNASKYGALSSDAGTVLVAWQADADRLAFSWREEGGPPVAEPARRGFGTRMLERGLAGELKGSAELRFEREGIIFTLEAPLPEIDEAWETAT